MSPTSARQDREFIEFVIPDRLLEEAIEWIRDNLDPDDVFSEEALREWAESAGFEESKS